jgi:septal ring factor EnvC (AmiA/AmiB activator)
MTIPELEEQLRQRDAQINKQAAQIKKQAARIKELEREIEELKKLLVEKAKAKEAKPPKEATNYSVGLHEQKRRKRRRRKKTSSVISPRRPSIFIGATPFGRNVCCAASSSCGG